MRNRHRMMPVLGLLICLPGCGMPGTWTSRDLEPEMARDEYFLLGPEHSGAGFTKATLRLRSDQSYSSEVYYGEHLQRGSGTWKQEDGKLTFVDSKGGSYTYEAELSGDQRRLTLTRMIEGTDVILVLERQ